jgi:hypothetical protein
MGRGNVHYFYITDLFLGASRSPLPHIIFSREEKHNFKLIDMLPIVSRSPLCDLKVE